MRKPSGQLALLVAFGALLSTGLTGCGTERSATAFCKVYWEQKKAYLAKYAGAASQARDAGAKDPLLGAFSGIASGLSAVGDIAIMFDKLDKVAPDSIEPDVAAVRDSIKSQISGAGGAYKDPVGTIAGGLVRSLAVAGSWDRVGKFVVAQCGEKG